MSDPSLVSQFEALEVATLRQLVKDVSALLRKHGVSADTIHDVTSSSLGNAVQSEEAADSAAGAEHVVGNTLKSRRSCASAQSASTDRNAATLTSQQLKQRTDETLAERQHLANWLCGRVVEDGSVQGQLVLSSKRCICVRLPDVVGNGLPSATCMSCISPELECRLLSELRCLEWPKKRHRAKRVTADRYLVIWRDPGPRPQFERLFQLLAGELMRGVEPWTHVAVTKNFVGSPHRDDQDQALQHVCSLGTFNADTGGQLCVEGPGSDGALRTLYVVNTKNRLTRIDGRYMHFVRRVTHEQNGFASGSAEVEVDRFSLVFYCLDESKWIAPGGPVDFRWR